MRRGVGAGKVREVAGSAEREARVSSGGKPLLTDRPALARVLAALRGQGKRVVLAEGRFDPLGPREVAFLEDAKTRGDYLVVAVRPAGAAVTKRRAEGLLALPLVDYVAVGDASGGASLLRALRPDVFALDRGRNPSPPEREAAREVGAVFAPCGSSRRSCARRPWG